MRVAIAPVTSQWAALALSGPYARDLLARLEPETDISAAGFPHMCYRETRLAGVPTRVARVSFTGELQYEISVPARYGASLLERVLELGKDYGARPVGMEAWLRLRLEKGYLHLGSDTNGRTTPLDIGMGGIIAKKPVDFIGKRALDLPFIYSTLHTSHKMLRDRPEIVQRAVAAFAEAVYFVEKNPDKAKASIAKAMNLKDEDALQSSYNVYAKEIVDRTMLVPAKSVAEAVENARESGTTIRRKPEEIFDNSFVNNLEKSGFLKELWGGENYRR
jgi:hypothetical protein